jgi:hypothetical protein
MSGIPVVNVNNCSTELNFPVFFGAPGGGQWRCGPAPWRGFEHMTPGALGALYLRIVPAHSSVLTRRHGGAVRFAFVALRYLPGWQSAHGWNAPLNTFAKIRAKASRHAANSGPVPLLVVRTGRR